MAVIDGLCTLANVKAALSISDSTQDTRLENLISSVSSMAKSYLGSNFKKTVYTAEVQTVNFNQIMLLNNRPLISVEAVRYSGGLVSASLYSFTPNDAAIGSIYMPQGWGGAMYNRGTFADPSIGARFYEFDYTAGYLLPADVGYSAGAATSLPLGLSSAVEMAVCELYYDQIRQGQGVSALSEGGLSYTFERTGKIFSDKVLRMLNLYKNIGVAG